MTLTERGAPCAGVADPSQAQDDMKSVSEPLSLDTLSCHPEERRIRYLDVVARREYWVYILANMHHTLYIGVTNDLQARVFEHKDHVNSGFTSKYGIDMLVYFESTNDVREALAREKQLKGWLRAKKLALIESVNPHWEDLSAGWFEP
jgi:putative endonuclease